MNKFTKTSIFILRISLGFMLLSAGIEKITNPGWSAAGYLHNAGTLSTFFGWLSLPGHIGIVNFLNEWGEILIGAALILGIAVRLASSFGVLLMILYYLPILKFPNVGNSLLIDEHIIFALIFLLFAGIGAGKIWGLDRLISRIRSRK